MLLMNFVHLAAQLSSRAFHGFKKKPYGLYQLLPSLLLPQLCILCPGIYLPRLYLYIHQPAPCSLSSESLLELILCML